MGALTDRIEGIFSLPLELMQPKRALKDAIRANEQAFFDLNEQQLDRGRDSREKSLGRYARFEYKNRFQPVDLKLTGDFREAFTLQVDDQQTEIFSQDWKDKILTGRYGEDIYGVPKKFIPSLAAELKPDFFKRVKELLIK